MPETFSGDEATGSKRKTPGASVRQVLYGFVQVIWGLPQTALGFAVFLAHARCPHFRYHGAVVTTWEARKALSLGLFVFVNGSGEACEAAGSVDKPLLVHEYGHTVQSLIVGPLYLLIVGLPSLVWMNVPAFARRRRKTGTSYYAFYTERTANWLGERVLNEPSIGLAMIDGSASDEEAT